MRRLTRGADQHERGSVAILVALMMAVFLGFGVIVIDVGALYQERRELQNGADAAAIAIAEDCGVGDCGDYDGTASGLADSNALDDQTTIDDVEIDLSAKTAKVDTSTSDAQGGSIVISRFGGILGIDGSTVRASATAKWGALQSGPTLPITISQCEWVKAGGTAGGDDSDPTLPTGIVGFAFHDGNSTDTCSGTSGLNVPGGFGWISTAKGSCEVELQSGGTVSSGPGAAPPKGCDPSDFAGQEITVPVFSGASGQGQNGTYEVWGFATIKVKAMRLLMGNSSWTWEESAGLLATHCPAEDTTEEPAPAGPGGNPGPKDQACLVGEFVKTFVPAGSIGGPGTPNLGTVAVELIA